jgi:mRNA-processing protein COX24
VLGALESNRLGHPFSPPSALRTLCGEKPHPSRFGAPSGPGAEANLTHQQIPQVRRLAVRRLGWPGPADPSAGFPWKGQFVGSVIKKRRKRMAKKKHRKLLKKTRVQRRKLGK